MPARKRYRFPDFAATAAGETDSDEAVQVLRGNVEFEKYFSTEPEAAFDWPIHPKNFSAPQLLNSPVYRAGR